MKEFKHSIELLESNLKDRQGQLKRTNELLDRSPGKNITDAYFKSEKKRLDEQVIDLQKALALLKRK